MIEAKWDLFEKLNNQKLMVGYDLGNEFSQISYFNHTKGEVETISTTLGMEEYNIPTVVCKRKGINQWYFGKEALRYARDEEVVLVDNLVKKAIKKEEIIIEEQSYLATALLVLFVKRSLALLGMVGKVDKIGAFMITGEDTSPEMIEMLQELVDKLSLKTEFVSIQTHPESIYYYLLAQPRELWQKEVVVLDCQKQGEALNLYYTSWNFNTTPFVSTYEHEIIETPESEQGEKEWDLFMQTIVEGWSKRNISSIYFIGQAFDESKIQETLRFLTRTRLHCRIFQGNNIYSKGAVYSLKDKIGKRKDTVNSIFLGMDKLQVNVGMTVYAKGKEQYFPLIDAGVDWFYANASCTFLLEEDTAFELILTPVNKQEVRKVAVVLEGFPQRAKHTAKVQLLLKMERNNSIKIAVKDLGFGEIYPSSELIWKKEIGL